MKKRGCFIAIAGWLAWAVVWTLAVFQDWEACKKPDGVYTDLSGQYVLAEHSFKELDEIPLFAGIATINSEIKIEQSGGEKLEAFYSYRPRYNREWLDVRKIRRTVQFREGIEPDVNKGALYWHGGKAVYRKRWVAWGGIFPMVPGSTYRKLQIEKLDTGDLKVSFRQYSQDFYFLIMPFFEIENDRYAILKKVGEEAQ